MTVNIKHYMEDVDSLSGYGPKKMSCNKCCIKNLETHYNFCPNCGVKFNKDYVIDISKEVIEDKDVGNIIDLFA